MRWFAAIFTLFFIAVLTVLAFDAGTRIADNHIGKISHAVENATR